MTDILIMPDGSRWKPSSSSDTVECVNCNNAVDTPEEIASYPDGNCPHCGTSWTGSESKSVQIKVTVPQELSGDT